MAISSWKKAIICCIFVYATCKECDRDKIKLTKSWAIVRKYGALSRNSNILLACGCFLDPLILLSRNVLQPVRTVASCLTKTSPQCIHCPWHFLSRTKTELLNTQIIQKWNLLKEIRTNLDVLLSRLKKNIVWNTYTTAFVNSLSGSKSTQTQLPAIFLSYLRRINCGWRRIPSIRALLYPLLYFRRRLSLSTIRAVFTTEENYFAISSRQENVCRSTRNSLCATEKCTFIAASTRDVDDKSRKCMPSYWEEAN